MLLKSSVLCLCACLALPGSWCFWNFDSTFDMPCHAVPWLCLLAFHNHTKSALVFITVQFTVKLPRLNKLNTFYKLLATTKCPTHHRFAYKQTCLHYNTFHNYMITKFKCQHERKRPMTLLSIKKKSVSTFYYRIFCKSGQDNSSWNLYKSGRISMRFTVPLHAVVWSSIAT